MGSTSANAAATKSILKPEMTLNGHREYIPSISYFPGGQRMISGSWDKTTRQWDLKAGREIEEAQNVCEGSVLAVAVSRDGRWVVTGGGGWTKNSGELKACEVDTGTVKTFEGHSQNISCIDISMDNTLLASGSEDKTARIWNLDTGKLVAGPFGESEDGVGAVRFSPDSKKLAVKLRSGRCLDVWDIRSQKLDVRVGEYRGSGARVTSSSMFWTNNNKNIIAAFSFTEDVPAKKIYEFNASTLEAVGAPFEGHTRVITSLALSFDGALLVSSSGDNTTKLWAFESRQLLASFDIRHLHRLILSPNSRQLAYTVDASGDYKIYICNIPRDILAQVRLCILRTHLLTMC
jgi:WD40 repeat protein